MMKRHRMNEPWFSDVFCVLHGAPCSTPPLSGKGALPVSSSGSIRMTCGIFTSYLGSFAVLLGKAAKYLRIIKPKKGVCPKQNDIIPSYCMLVPMVSAGKWWSKKAMLRTIFMTILVGKIMTTGVPNCQRNPHVSGWWHWCFTKVSTEST